MLPGHGPKHLVAASSPRASSSTPPRRCAAWCTRSTRQTCCCRSQRALWWPPRPTSRPRQASGPGGRASGPLPLYIPKPLPFSGPLTPTHAMAGPGGKGHVTLSDGQQLSFDYCVVATGSSYSNPIKPDMTIPVRLPAPPPLLLAPTPQRLTCARITCPQGPLAAETPPPPPRAGVCCHPHRAIQG